MLISTRAGLAAVGEALLVRFSEHEKRLGRATLFCEG